MKKLLATLMILLLLAGCSKPTDNPSEDTKPVDTQPSVAEELDTTPASSEATQNSDPSQEVTETTASDLPRSEETEAHEEEEVIEEEPIIEEIDIDCRAWDILQLLNSDHVHAKFTMGESYDGESILGDTIEYFIDGKNMVFIDDYSITIIDGETIVMIYHDEMIYIVEEYDPEHFGRAFGYAPEAYTFSYEEEDDGFTTEVLLIEQYGNTIISTWNFYDDGSIIVKEENEASGAFTVYSFEVIDEDISQMDMSIPDGYTEY